MRRWSKVSIFFATLSLLSSHIIIAQERQGDSHILPFAWCETLTPEELKTIMEEGQKKYPEFKRALDTLGLTVDDCINAKKMWESGTYTLKEILAYYGVTPEQLIEVFSAAKKDAAYRKLRENEYILEMNYDQLKEERAKQRKRYLLELSSLLGITITKEDWINAFESGISFKEFLNKHGLTEDQFRNALRNLWMSK